MFLFFSFPFSFTFFFFLILSSSFFRCGLLHSQVSTRDPAQAARASAEDLPTPPPPSTLRLLWPVPLPLELTGGGHCGAWQGRRRSSLGQAWRRATRPSVAARDMAERSSLEPVVEPRRPPSLLSLLLCVARRVRPRWDAPVRRKRGDGVAPNLCRIS